jgi:hypothetical protein
MFISSPFICALSSLVTVVTGFPLAGKLTLRMADDCEAKQGSVGVSRPHFGLFTFTFNKSGKSRK